MKELSKIFGKLYHQVMMSGIFIDSKSFADAIRKKSIEEILSDYTISDLTNIEALKSFVEKNFEIPQSPTSNFKTNPKDNIDQHIMRLWEVLKRSPDPVEESSRIALPHHYIVPGGRFSEIYYWDSFFTMLGLKIHGKIELIESMILNFEYLINKIGFIPNGTRSYFLNRSQPPFFSLMVSLLAEINGEEIMARFLPSMLKEYAFWMKPDRAIELPDGILNRYYDNCAEARPESYREDVELVQGVEDKSKMFLSLRAACESGWDFSSRWLKKDNDLSTIVCSEMLPVDLNCLLAELEKNIARGYLALKEDNPNNKLIAEKFSAQFQKRKDLIQKYFWNAEMKAFVDFNFIESQQCDKLTAAAVVPLFFRLCNLKQAKSVSEIIKKKLLASGGLLTTAINSGQQWDAPNGWAPLQWMAVKGLDNYGLKDEAKEIALSFAKTVERVFYATGKLLEKYNVEDEGLMAGGGEYPVQDGFGWTNGVYLALKEYIQ